ncbi:hypothetical protein TRIUR3_24279 [Triticum urartu]|uniref:Altered inheritance of mitochondria protein 32 n=1 Tax=Triticum urartu TaxID=4572 RepID=M8ALX7_TRIUA|nr:hypothetical protein TRIUR3_24279 [Triticum urartu]
MRFDFESDELGKEKTVGTVDERDLFVCYMGPEAWPSHLEATKSDRLPHLLAAAIKARKPEMMKSTELTICEEEGTESSLGDVLIFPDMIRYRGLTCSNVNTFVEEVLMKDADWHDGFLEAIRGSYVFVCCHESKDSKCGASGPALIRKFKEGIEAQGLGPQVIVRACSHLGGHECLGTVIIFSSDAKGEVTGHWYGYVSPDDVNLLLNKHMRQNETGDHIRRGQLGLSEEQHLEDLELKRVKNGITVLKKAGTGTGGEDNLMCSLQDIMDLSPEVENLEFDSSKMKETDAMYLAALAGDGVPQQIPPCPDAISSESRSEVEVPLQQAPSHQTAIIPQNANSENGAAEMNGHNTDGLEEENGRSAADKTILQRSEVEAPLQQAPSHQIAITPENANNEIEAAEVNGHNTDGLEEENGRSEVQLSTPLQKKAQPSDEVVWTGSAQSFVANLLKPIQVKPESFEPEALEPLPYHQRAMTEHIQDPNAADPTGLRNDIIKKKFLIPEDFNGEAVLDHSDVHKVRTAQELRNIIENTSGWLSARITKALLVNGSVFQIPVHMVIDKTYRKSGAVCVVRGEELPHVPVETSLYTHSLTAVLAERRPQYSHISDMVIEKHDFRGNLWARRRYSLQGDNEYHVLQWLPKVVEDTKAIKVNLEMKTQQAEEAPADDFSIKKCIAVVKTIEELSTDEKLQSEELTFTSCTQLSLRAFFRLDCERTGGRCSGQGAPVLEREWLGFKAASPTGGSRRDRVVGLLGCGPVLLLARRGGVAAPPSSLWCLLRPRAGCCRPWVASATMLQLGVAGSGRPGWVRLVESGRRLPTARWMAPAWWWRRHGAGGVRVSGYADQLPVAGCVGVWRPVLRVFACVASADADDAAPVGVVLPS